MAYAALLSLNVIVDQIPHSNIPKRFEIEFLKENITFLLIFFEQYSQISSEEIQDLERETVEAANLADLVIECHSLDQMLKKSGRSGKNSSTLCFEDIEFVKSFDSIKTKAKKIMDVRMNEKQRSRSFTPSRSAPSLENTMVGYEEHLIQIMGKITSHKSDLQMLSVVGMGGIGKTTLTRNVYDSNYISEKFQIRIWVTISQSYDVQNILLSFLHDFGIVDDQIDLGESLYKTLWGRRYLIVIDDVWSTEVLDAIKRFFPDNCNGSRVIITSRLINVASHIGSCSIYKLDLLNEHESWNLLKQKVFAQDGCPSTLENIGRKIALSCNGLPLAIVAIAGQLAKSDMTNASWENVAGALNSIVNSENDNQILKILSFSYDNLPVYLKPCFLLMAAFPEGSVISVSGLFKVWIAEGILKPNRNKCLEDTAMEFLTNLVERNLVLVNEWGSSGKMKRCRIHDLFRDLCLRKAHEVNFLYSRTFYRNQINKYTTIINERGYSSQLQHTRSGSFELSEFESVSKWDLYDGENLWNYRIRCILLSASQAVDVLTCSASLASLPMFWNLQTLIMTEIPGNEPVVLPPHIWTMPLIRHLKIQRVILPDPPISQSHVKDKESCVLENLQTLEDVHNFKLSVAMLKKIPNLKKLKITCSEVSNSAAAFQCQYLDKLAQLCKLESLKCSMYENIFSKQIAFPQSLKKLTLDGGQNPWDEMTIIGLLPYLEVLRLKNDAFCGSEWRPVEGEFCGLKTLHLQSMTLQHWEADSIHFPRLERLILYNVWRMRELPLGIGDISTLHLISLELCSSSLMSSAKLVMEEQECWGNHDIRFRLPMQKTIELIPHCLNLLLQSNNDAQVVNLECDLRQLNSFLNYTKKKGREDEMMKDFVRHIRDVMYEAEDIVDTILQSGKSLSNSLRRLLFIVKEVEYISVRAQRILLSVSDNEDCTLYNDPVDILNITKAIKVISSRAKHMFSGFALYNVTDEISEENEKCVMYREFGADSSRLQDMLV